MLIVGSPVMLSLSLPWTKKVPVCPAQAIYVLGVVGKGSPSSPGKKKYIYIYIYK